MPHSLPLILGHEKHDDPRKDGKTGRSRDGSFTRKNDRTYFGYKGHTIVDDNRIPILRSCAVTTAKDHDTAIDLSKKGITVYRNKGCFGHDPGGTDGTASFPWNPCEEIAEHQGRDQWWNTHTR